MTSLALSLPLVAIYALTAAALCTRWGTTDQPYEHLED